MNILTYLRLRVNEVARDAGASEEGAVATEYVFLLVFIAIAITAGAIALGGAINGRFEGAATQVGGAGAGT